MTNETTKGGRNRTIRDIIAAQKRGISLPEDPHIAIDSLAPSEEMPAMLSQTEESELEDISSASSFENLKNSEEVDTKPEEFDMFTKDVEEFINAMLATDTKYDNSKKTVSLDKAFKDILDTISQFYRIDISQLLNNILAYTFRNGKYADATMSELLRRIHKKQQYVLTQSFRLNKRK